MKLKRLLALWGGVFSLALNSAFAQTDVTSDYITNGDFSSTEGWTLNAGGGTEHNEGSGLIGTLNLNNRPSTTDATHLATEYCFGFTARWNGRYTYYTQTAENLPAGAYTLSYDVQDVNTTSTKYNMDNYFYVQVGETKYSDNATEWMNAGASSWTAHSISFILNEPSDITISFGYGNKENKGSGDCPAIYVSHLKLEVSPFATSSDYDALNSAISTAEGITWGFDEGEYAPYNYVEVIQALAEAKEIDQKVNNSQAKVQALTATLNTKMTANVAEVNAIWDPSFEHEYSTSGNVQPIAWTGTDGRNNATDVRWMWNVSSNAGLAATSSNKALFTKYGVFYGQQAGYTMPLNADTYYTISFVYGGWSDCKRDGYVTMADPSSASLTLVPTDELPLDAVDGNSNSSSWKKYQAFFKTNAAGDYVLGLRKKKESEQSQYVYGDFVLKTTTIDEATAYYKAVKDEVDDSYNAEANGGNEKKAFKEAIDASAPATVAEIMEAAANLYTLRDAFVAATPKYDALETERASAIAIGVTSEDANAVTMTEASQLQEKLNALYVLEDAAATAKHTVDATILLGTWTSQNMDEKSGQHWSGDAGRKYYDRWQNSGYTASITNTMTLPAGKYVFKVAARAHADGINGAFNMSVKVGEDAAVQKDFVAKNDTGYGIETSGVANYSEDGTYANGTGRGWEWRFIGFELSEEKSVKMTAYAQILANYWVGFSDATLLTTEDNVGVLKLLLNAELDIAKAIDKTTNVGEGVFQTPSSAVEILNTEISTAQGVYNNASATSSEVSTAISNLKAAETTYKATVNAPETGKRYYLKVATSGHAKENNAAVISLGETSENNPTGYSLNASAAPATHLAQAFIFTQVSDNNYNISIELPEGLVYLTYGSLNGSAAGWKTQQIQATTNAEKKGVFRIEATSTANVFKIFNPEHNNYIDCQDGGSLYTDTDISKEEFTVEEATQASVTMSGIKAGKYATRIFPFTPTLPSGIKAYRISAIDGTSLMPEEVAKPKANVPYLLKNETAVDYTGAPLTGYGTATADTYTSDYLTGSFVAGTYVPKDSYVMQTPKSTGKQGFYQVENENSIQLGQYRAYLTVPAAGDVKSFILDGDETDGIRVAEAEQNGTETIYTLSGQRVQKAQKGIYIVNGKKVVIK